MAPSSFDLSFVSKALIDLLKQAISSSAEWSKPTPSVSPLPPDEVGDGLALGLHLFHVRGDPTPRPRQPRPSSGPAQAEVELELFYILSAYHEAGNSESLWEAQFLFGFAHNVLWGNPVIEIEGSDALIRIVSSSILPDDILKYWTSYSSSPRLSAGYQVKVSREAQSRAEDR